MNKSKTKFSPQISFNLIAGITTFIISIFISLFITPIIVEKLGSEAYGFVNLANSFVGYASLITVALNSMESRFVSICIYRDDYKGANRYFTSVFFANLLIAVVLAPIMFLFVWHLDSFLEVPAYLIGDVKAAFAIVFIQFLTEILTSRFEIALYVTNRLNLYYINQIISSAIRLFVIIIGFKLFSVKIIFLVLGSFIGKLFVVQRNIHYTKKYLPNLKINKRNFEFSSIKEVTSSGIWNLVSKLSGILLDGLDLLIANIFIGASEMGALSLSKTVPAMFLNMRGTLDYPFSPPMTECYAKGDIAGVVHYARLGNKILGIFMIAPMAVFFAFGQSFFSLWVPGEDARLLQILSLLSIVSLLAGSCINSVFTIFTITNHVKVNSLVILATGIATTITVFIILNISDLGIYAIAGVSSFYALLRNFIFTPLYGAHCLGIKKITFYYDIIKGFICFAINSVICFGVKYVISSNTWITFLLACCVAGVFCVGINIMIVFSKNDRRQLLSMIKAKVK